jgi:hypothetical protein
LGYTGSQGAGYTGSKGDAGYNGSTGYDGSQGATGYNGSVGYTGSVGYNGSQGVGYTGSQGDKGGLRYTFSTAITDSDPGGGNFKFNNATIASVTQIYIDLVDVNIIDVTATIDSWDDSTNANKGMLVVQSNNNGDNTLATFQLTSTTTTAGYRKLNVTYLSGAAPSNSEDCIITFHRTGDVGYNGSRGDIGYTGSRGTTGYDGSVGYNGSQGVGYTGSQGTTGYDGSVGSTGYTGSQGVGYTGSQGATGYNGSTGYDGSIGSTGYTGSQGVGYTGSAGTTYTTASDVQLNSLGLGTAASATTGELRATDNITAYYSSDRRLKENIEPILNALDSLLQINGVRFDWKDGEIEKRGGEDGYFVRKRDIGVIAQEIESILPEAVATRDDGIKAVRYELIVPLLIQAIKELYAIVKDK